jgi:hypothetical protein
MKKTLLSLLLFIPFVGFGQLLISATNTPIIQNFDGLGTSLSPWTNNSTLTGFYARTDATASITSYFGNTGSTTSAGLYSYGAPFAADRSMGYATSNTFTGTASSGRNLIGLRLKNTTGSTLKSLRITYTGEQWRKDNSADIVHSMTVDYQLAATTTTITDPIAGTWTNLPELTFNSPIITGTNGALDGNATANKTTLTTTFNLSSDLLNGDEIMIRWADVNDPNNDHHLTIDDLSITAFSTLPISLTSFTGKPVDKSILLNWETASESNNDYFEVLKSTNGKTFTAVGTVKGSGTTKETKNYSLVDNNPAAGTNYYQLVQHDFDGKSSKSAIIPVNSAISSSSLTVYAAANSVDVSINSANITEGTLQIFDVTGKKLNETKLTLAKGFNTTTVPLSLNSGIYVVSFVSESEVINSKFIKD